jgi:RimJ/RimL family protein N-acetyltransferase
MNESVDPLSIDLPRHIVTERLILRCPTPEDVPQVNEAVAESLDELRRWMPWARSAPTAERADAELRRMQAKFLLREDLAMFMFERSTADVEGRFVGGTGLHRIDWRVRCFELGYWRRSSLARGTGLVDEAVQALTRLAFDTLVRSASRCVWTTRTSRVAASPSATASPSKACRGATASRREGAA